MKLNTFRMHRDILKKLNRTQTPQHELIEKVGLSRSTLWRMSKGKDITVTTFLKIIEWLDVDLKYYIVNDDFVGEISI